jgi:hypothetical protein
MLAAFLRSGATVQSETGSRPNKNALLHAALVGEMEL